MAASCQESEAEKQPQIITFPPSCLTDGMRFSSQNTVFGLWQTVIVDMSPKNLSLQHIDPEGLVFAYMFKGKL